MFFPEGKNIAPRHQFFAAAENILQRIAGDLARVHSAHRDDLPLDVHLVDPTISAHLAAVTFALGARPVFIIAATFKYNLERLCHNCRTVQAAPVVSITGAVADSSDILAAKSAHNLRKLRRIAEGIRPHTNAGFLIHVLLHPTLSIEEISDDALTGG